MKPYYGAINDIGQWWDGKDWRNHGATFRAMWEDALRAKETLRQHDNDNCHVDGVFECCRCRKPHFIPDNFDLLCDGCVATVLTHPKATKAMLDGINLWKQKARLGKADPDIAERYRLRDKFAEISSKALFKYDPTAINIVAK